jgi:diguanylate cyclase (GGDEF)-like protein
MISIKEYLEQPQMDSKERMNSDESPLAAPPADVPAPPTQLPPPPSDLLPVAVSAYRSALAEMGNCGQEACPTLGVELKQKMGKLSESLCAELSRAGVEATESGVREQLQSWGRCVASHCRQQTSEVKELLLVMAHTAESVGVRDQKCAEQITAVTTRLKSIANLEDLTEIRESIKKSATELKSSIDRMTAEGKAAMDRLKAEVSSYQTRLEEAEEIASRDALTGLHSRLWAEAQIEKSLQGRAPFCVAILDLNGFKQVNDEHGHLVGDELLKKFSEKMRSICRVTDTIGRWGGDEFMLLLHCGLKEAQGQIDRLREWVCVNYTIKGNAGPIKLKVKASIGLAERLPNETMKALVDRADGEMYREKAASRAEIATGKA